MEVVDTSIGGNFHYLPTVQRSVLQITLTLVLVQYQVNVRAE